MRWNLLLVKTVETAKDLEYYINLVGKLVAEFEMIDSSFTVGKMLLNSIACYREIIHERNSQLIMANFIVDLF